VGGAAGQAGSGGKSGSASAACPKGKNAPSDVEPVDVGLVSAQIVDQDGAPTSSGLVQVCGKNLCFDAGVGDNGKLAKQVNDSLTLPACKFGDGLTWGKLAIPLGAGDSALGTLMTVRLPDFADSAPLLPGTSVSSGGVTLSLDAAAHVEVDFLTYEDQTQQGFRAAPLPEPALTQLRQDFVAGYALSPLETRICPSPALSLPNTTNLAPGTALELLLLGLNVTEEWAPYGSWLKVGEGLVADDGETLEFSNGVPLLTAIGVREKR
jgi:hypothetical protein